MYSKINSASCYTHGNSGSCAALVQYLEKENDDLKIGEREMFFNENASDISSFEVINEIDKNGKKQLGKDEAKFYMVSVNPSQDELKHLASIAAEGKKISSPDQLNLKEKAIYNALLKDYTRKVMNNYAENFNRGLNGNNILYYAKLENKRTYAWNDKKVLENRDLEKRINRSSKAEKKRLEKFLHRDKVTNKIIRVGLEKGGFQQHIHIVVSRKDKSGKIKLSPLANSRGSKNKLNGKEVKIGFNRKEFAEKNEQTFDNQFKYNRNFKNSFKYRNFMKNGVPIHFASKFAYKLGGKELGQATQAITKAANYSKIIKENPSQLSANVGKDVGRKVYSKIQTEDMQLISQNAERAAQIVKAAVTAAAAPEKLAVEAVKQIAKIVMNSL